MRSLKKKKNTKNIELINQVDSFVAESYLKTQLAFNLPESIKKLQVIAITSANQNRGKSTTIGNLTVLYAEKVIKVHILNLDLRRTSIHKFFHIENKVSIVDNISGGDILRQNCQACYVNRVDIINSDTHTPFLTKVFESSKLTDLISDLRKKYDYILIDTPPIFVNDALLSIFFTDGYIVVCSQHATYKKELLETVNALEDKKANIIGIVMTMSTKTESSSHKSKYGYGYKNECSKTISTPTTKKDKQ